MLPKNHDQVQGIEYNDSEAYYEGSGWQPWHYEYFDYWTASNDYVDGLYTTAQLIPVKSVWPMGYPGTGQRKDTLS